MERAREYDRVSEWLAKNKNRSSGDALDTDQKNVAEYGIEGRRLQFQKDSYRQPVLTRRPMNPKNYRRGQSDPEADFCRKRLRELRDTQCTSGTSLSALNQESMEVQADYHAPEAHFDAPEDEERGLSAPGLGNSPPEMV